MAPRDRFGELKRREKHWQDSRGQRLMRESFAQPGPRSVYDRQNARVAATVAATPGARLLEVGCGGGQLLACLRAREPALRCVGLDVSSALAALQSDPALAGVGLVVGDGEQLPFATASFDVVVFNGALHHLPDFRAGIREAARVLRPGGQLVLHEPVSTAFSRTVHHALDPFVLSQTEYESPVDQELKDAFRLAPLREALREAGFEGVESWHDLLAYPLTGCYAGGPLSHDARPFEWLMALEERLLRRAGIGRALSAFCWRLLLVAHASRSTGAFVNDPG